MNARVALATIVALAAPCIAQQPKPQPMKTQPAITQTMGMGSVERIRDINLNEAQEAAIAGIRDEYAPRVEEAIDHLTSVIKEETDQVRAVLTPEQLHTLQGMKEEHRVLRIEGLASRIAHLRDIDLTQDEIDRIAEIRREYRPKYALALEGLKGVLTPEQAKAREAALKAGQSRRAVIASLDLTEEQQAKVDAAGKEVRTLMRTQLEEMRDVLDPEQQAKLAAMREDRREHVRDRLAFAIANYDELELTQEQKIRIAAIRTEYRPRVEEAGNQLRAVIREELAGIIAVLRAP